MSPPEEVDAVEVGAAHSHPCRFDPHNGPTVVLSGALEMGFAAIIDAVAGEDRDRTRRVAPLWCL